MKKLLYPFIVGLFLFGCGSTTKKLYRPVAAVGPIGIFAETADKICEHELSAIDKTKDKLVEKGYSQLSTGIGIAVISFVLSLFIANHVIQRFGNYGVVGGSAWALAGLSKIFVATLLTYIFWGAILLLAFGALIVARKRGLDKWIISALSKRGSSSVSLKETESKPKKIVESCSTTDHQSKSQKDL